MQINRKELLSNFLISRTHHQTSSQNSNILLIQQLEIIAVLKPYDEHYQLKYKLHLYYPSMIC